MSLPDERCPECGALVRAGTPWCTLCHTDLRPPAPAPEPAPEPIAEVLEHDSVLLDPLTAPLSVLLGQEPSIAPVAAPQQVDPGPVDALITEVPVASTGGKHARPAAQAAPAGGGAASYGDLPPEYTDLLVNPDDTEVAFALLRAEGRDPYLAKLEGPLSSPGARAGLIIGGAAVLGLALFTVAALVGAIFR